MDHPLPSYNELPIATGLPDRSSWGLFDDPRLGTLSLLGPDQALAGIAAVRDGETFSLNLELALPDPPLFGRPAFTHEVVGPLGGVHHDDLLHDWNTQSSSQWDGFRHIAHPAHGFYGGVADEEHGIDVAASRGIVARAVLLDVERHFCLLGRPIDPNSTTAVTAADLEATAAAQESTIEIGDILLIRTGWLSWYRGLDSTERKAVADDLRSPGLEASDDTFRFLWDHHVAAIAADNPALEVWPLGANLDEGEAGRRYRAGRPDLVFGHMAILSLLGIPIGELFDLDALAQACAADHRYEGLFTSAPLRLAGGVASPPNALFIR